jgi:phosphatidylinositol alpha-1,6-mannosyltransferase
MLDGRKKGSRQGLPDDEQFLILIIQTTYSAHGGIPTYNRTACHALAQWNKTIDAIEKRVLLVMDRPADVSEAAASLPGLTIEAFSGNRLAFVRRAFAIALTHQIDLLLVGHVNYAPLGAILKRLQPKLRYGVFAYGVDVWDKLTKVRAYSLRQADFVVSISEYTKQILIGTNGVSADNIRLAPPSLEEDLEIESEPNSPIEQVANADNASPQITLLSVCRLELSERYKGVDKVIEALPTVLAQYPQVQYFVIGSGSDLDRHKKLAQEKGVAKAVHFLGPVDDATLQNYYQKCDVFVMCSAREGFGIVYLEAMRYAKPVIAANSGGAPEVVKDRETGLLVEYGDVNQTAAAIAALCSDAALRKKLGDAGRKRLENNYTFAHFKQRLHEIILAELPPHVINHEQPSVGLADSTF